MARGLIVSQVINSRAGVSWPGSETAGDVVNGHYFVWGPRKILTVRNATGGAVNITFTPQSTRLDVFSAPPKVASISIGAQKVYGPFPSYYMHPEDGDRVYVDVAGAVVLKVFDIGQG